MRRLILSALLLSAALALPGCGQEQAPESSFVLLDGSNLSSSQLKGKVTLVNFWATSCTTCQAELAKVVAAARTGSLDALKAAVGPAGASCKACHDNFRKD